MAQGIENKVVVITRASSGLGEATARHLAERGAIVVLGARRADRIKALANELTAKGHKARAVQTDVTNQVKHLVDSAVREFGRIDVMLNNVGPIRFALALFRGWNAIDTDIDHGGAGLDPIRLDHFRATDGSNENIGIAAD